MEYHEGTKDSVFEGNNRTATPSELAEIIKTKNYNRYYGGRINSIDATLDYFEPGFIYKGTIVIYGTESEFKELEELIYESMDYFTSREYQNF